MKITYNLPSFDNIESILGPTISEITNTLINSDPEHCDIDEIFITENIWNEIESYFERFGLNLETELKPKGLDHVGKIMIIDGKAKLFYNVIFCANIKGMQMYSELIIGRMIEKEIMNLNGIKNIEFDYTNINSCINTFILTWTIDSVTRERIEIIFIERAHEYDSTEDFIYTFKRNIKKLHWDYQSNKDDSFFLKHSLLELERFISRIIKHSTDNNFFCEDLESEVKNIIKVISDNKNNYGNVDQISSEIIKKNVLSILEKCDIHLNSSKDRIKIKVKYGPKKLFPELVDTHQRIVCFMDILGFSAIIEEYETDESSVILRDINKALNIAVDTAINLPKANFDKELKEHFEYRMFSDCIIMSLPYIEFGVDFKQQFYFLTITIQAFQQSMLSFGFYIRGNISTGSYYSTPNMLFSGGLVKAHNNERPTKYPIISVSNDIIDRLNKKTEWDNSLMPMGKILIKHKYNSGEPKIFINPLQTIQSFNDTLLYLDNTAKEIFRDIGLTNSENLFSNLVENLPKTHSQSSIQSTMDKAIRTINDKLIEKIKELKDKNAGPSNSEDQLKLNESIMEKYVFLENLFVWLENGESDLFEYYLFE